MLKKERVLLRQMHATYVQELLQNTSFASETAASKAEDTQYQVLILKVCVYDMCVYVITYDVCACMFMCVSAGVCGG